MIVAYRRDLRTSGAIATLLVALSGLQAAVRYLRIRPQPCFGASLVVVVYMHTDSRLGCAILEKERRAFGSGFGRGRWQDDHTQTCYLD